MTGGPGSGRRSNDDDAGLMDELRGVFDREGPQIQATEERAKGAFRNKNKKAKGKDGKK